MTLEENKDLHPIAYIKGMKMIEKVKAWLAVRSVTFCNFAYDMNGVLTDQSSYYLTNEKEIVKELNWKAEEIVDALTLKTNFAIIEPLAK